MHGVTNDLGVSNFKKCNRPFDKYIKKSIRAHIAGSHYCFLFQLNSEKMTDNVGEGISARQQTAIPPQIRFSAVIQRNKAHMVQLWPQEVFFTIQHRPVSSDSYSPKFWVCHAKVDTYARSLSYFNIAGGPNFEANVIRWVRPSDRIRVILFPEFECFGRHIAEFELYERVGEYVAPPGLWFKSVGWINYGNPEMKQESVPELGREQQIEQQQELNHVFEPE
ncbi:hypothetical protein ACI3LW_000351 [Candidozyma auris]|nr:hypothetical protein QG37_06540 [[Candida] auris]